MLDLFAGTGAMGIEALSRGASSAVFVESAPAAVKVINENLRRAKLSARATIRRQDALSALRQRLGPFDLVLVDPPYRHPRPALEALLSEIAGQGVVSAGGRVILTRSTRSYMPVIPLDWTAERRLAYGDAVVFVFRTP